MLAFQYNFTATGMILSYYNLFKSIVQFLITNPNNKLIIRFIAHVMMWINQRIIALYSIALNYIKCIVRNVFR